MASTSREGEAATGALNNNNASCCHVALIEIAVNRLWVADLRRKMARTFGLEALKIIKKAHVIPGK